MAQYAISEINDKRLLIDAAEFGWIKEHGSEDNTWADIESRPESERKVRLVYGCFLKNPSQVTGPLDPKSFSAMKGMEMAYVYFEAQRRSCFYASRSLKLLDIEILDQNLGIDRCPFAAIIDLADEVPRTKKISLSAFPFNSGLTVQQNIKSRLGILAINDEDRRNRKRSAIDWRLLIDWPRARRAADRLQ
jgi:hypothetical protein